MLLIRGSCHEAELLEQAWVLAEGSDTGSSGATQVSIFDKGREQMDTLAHLDERALFSQAHNTVHASREALGAELSQQNGEKASQVASQKVVSHAGTCPHRTRFLLSKYTLPISA